MKKLIKTPIQSIREKCLDCTAGSRKEIRLCTVVQCALYPYRFGRRPSKTVVDTIEEFHKKNTAVANGLLAKKGT
ncbi:uncharacterized protein METZ01_LOCUS237350 [marine metagenome]|jgi:hypothetical protein|uniref:Uncharacterized protein n=1 Tax=marine metagenome TaxID=408172 RepID=A0A382HB42_9ZZZZ|tara:strand:- start:411 stop:635 length:225 start_codon:yes stop_codon:yes gene_type:complete